MKRIVRVRTMMMDMNHPILSRAEFLQKRRDVALGLRTRPFCTRGVFIRQCHLYINHQ